MVLRVTCERLYVCACVYIDEGCFAHVYALRTAIPCCLAQNGMPHALVSMATSISNGHAAVAELTLTSMAHDPVQTVMPRAPVQTAVLC